jgi:hypothetical protein
MDFSTRGSQPSPAAPRPGTTLGGSPAAQPKSEGKKGLKGPRGKWGKIASMAMLVVVALLMLGVIGILVTSRDRSESSYIDSSKLQAVFLTNDQVYFGKISKLTGKTLVLNNVYYLQTQSTTQKSNDNSNVSLVKLGCELHKPFDTMVINRAEVQFWENLQADGQVANAVKSFQDQNPNGQKCSTTTNTGTGVQGSNATTNNSSSNSSSNKSDQ